MGLFERLASPGVENISPADAYQRLQSDGELIVIDVRQPIETQDGTVPGALLIPLTEFGRRMSELPDDRTILTVCRSGHRSPIAARRLKRAGYDVVNVSGGIMAWQRAGLPLEPPLSSDH